MKQLRIRGASGETTLEIGDELVLGRGEDLDDPEISRRHAKVTRSAGGALLIEDLGSRNGTFLNGERVAAPHVLHAGDRILIGHTEVEVFEASAAPGASPAPAPAPVPALARPAAKGPATPYSPVATPRRFDPTRRSPLVPIAVVTVVVLSVALVVAVRHHSQAAGFDCVNHPAPSGPVAITAYTEANIAGPGDNNAVLVVRYSGGDLHPLPIDCFETEGKGSADLSDRGVLDADQQLIVNPAHTRLFAVNQGSDTIAVFDIQQGGDLQAVPGSPFASGGTSPASLGLSGNHLLVVNKANDGVRNLDSSNPNVTSFTVGSGGSLTAVAGSTFQLPRFENEGQALISPNGRVMFGTGPGSPLRAYTVNSDGTFAPGPNSPMTVAPAAYTPGFPLGKRFSVGLGVHPTLPLMYASLPPASGLAVYSYDDSANLTFDSAVANQGSWLPCWTLISRDGNFLYTANAGSDNVTVFDLRQNPEVPRQIQSFPFDQPGNPWNIAFDPSNQHLLVLTPRDLPNVAEGQGNTLHVLSVAADGTLSEVPTAFVKLPVPVGSNPQGLAVT